MFRAAIGTLMVLTSVMVMLPSSNPLWGCAAVSRARQRVEIADESAIIIWDASTKTEHFIRRASFTTPADDFGFLVPTPTKPALAEASDSAFSYLERLTAPPRPSPRPSFNSHGRPIPMSAARPPVRVIETKRVAG
jgi:hypothetical protein